MTTTNGDQAVPAIRVSGLEYRYPDGKEALRGVEFTVRSWRIGGPGRAQRSRQKYASLALERSVADTEPGCLAAMATWVGTAPAGPAEVWHQASGSTAWRSTTVTHPRSAGGLGLVFQDPDDQLFCNTVVEDVAFGPLNMGKTAAKARRIALDCLDRVDLRESGRSPSPSPELRRAQTRLPRRRAGLRSIGTRAR